MIRSLRGPVVALLSTAILVILISRLISTAWIHRLLSEQAYQRVVPVMWFNFSIDFAVLASVFFAVKWLVGRDRRDRLDKARLDHLAEVAAMSGGLAHEARNLLHALQARIALLRKHVVGNEKDEDRVNKIEDLATDMEHLFTDFLTLARPAEDQLDQADVASLLQQVLEFEELELERANIEVQCHFDSTAPPALIDRAKLKRALLNLIVNARHAMPDGGRLTLHVVPHGRCVQIEVEDTGNGISRDNESRIFQSYFTTKSDGTGLGLAIVKRTIEDLGGKIQFTSTLGQGTKFTITLPSIEQHQTAIRRALRELSSRRSAEQMRMTPHDVARDTLGR